MPKDRRYIFNKETLTYEVVRQSRRSRVFKTLTLFAVSLLLAGFYFWIYVSVLGLEPPKTALLKKSNAEWSSRIEVLNRQLDQYNEDLTSLQMRDDDIYRSIFGMNELPAAVRHA